MRIAAISDVHGNLPALEAVLANIRAAGVDQIVFCGDIVLGAPDDKACYDRIMEMGVPVIRGNTDRYVFEFGTESADPRWTTEQFGPLQYAASQFSDSERQALGSHQTNYRLPGIPEILFYHANPRNDMDILRAWATDEEIERNFDGIDARVFVGGHTHTQYVRYWRGVQIVICGSVGFTNDHAAGAQYVLLERKGDSWCVEHQDVKYDVTKTIQRFAEVRYIEKAGPIGRLFVRAMATRTNQLEPFLRWYRGNGAPQSLSKAVDAFLNLY